MNICKLLLISIVLTGCNYNAEFKSEFLQKIANKDFVIVNRNIKHNDQTYELPRLMLNGADNILFVESFDFSTDKNGSFQFLNKKFEQQQHSLITDLTFTFETATDPLTGIYKITYKDSGIPKEERNLQYKKVVAIRINGKIVIRLYSANQRKHVAFAIEK
ncbi:MAG: hypothetical protein ACRCVW_03245 [Brevinema sp.]